MFGAVWAQADLRRVLKAIGADVLETALAVPAAHEAFTAGGELRDRRLAMALPAIVGDLVQHSPGRAA